jgi:hypothetical protein
MDQAIMALLMGGGAALGGIFGKSKSDKVKIPAQVDSAMSRLMELARDVQNVDVPLREILPMTETEQKAYEGLGQYVGAGPTEEFNLAKDIAMRMAGESTDISQMPEWKGAMADLEKTLGSQLSRTMRIGQIGGMSDSSPLGKALARDYETARKNIVGQYLPYALQLRSMKGTELDRLLGIGEYEEGAPLRKLGAVSAFNLPRTLEQQQSDEIYNQMMNAINMKYQTAPDIYSRVLGSSASQPVVQGASTSDAFTNAMLGASTTAQLLPFLFGGGTSFADDALAKKLDFLY